MQHRMIRVIRLSGERAHKSQESLDIKRFGYVRDKAFFLHLPDIFLAAETGQGDNPHVLFARERT